MSVEYAKTPPQQTTRAAEGWLEANGNTQVENSYHKVTILVLGAVCLMLGAITVKSNRALANVKPLIVRINDVGRAEAIDYRSYEYKPQEEENKYYLTRWANLFFQRNRYTIERDQTQSLYFFGTDEQQSVIEQERKSKTIATYQSESSLPYVDIEVKQIILDDLKQSPYSARIEFEKVFISTQDHTEIKREKWTASVTYVFKPVVKNDQLVVNPLGLTIIRHRVDQAVS